MILILNCEVILQWERQSIKSRRRRFVGILFTMILLAFTLCFIGFILLSFSMGKHVRQIWPQRVLSNFHRWNLRATGYGCLLAALVPAIAAQGTFIGFVLWSGLLTVAALPLTLLLTYRPLWVPRAGLLAVLIGASSLALAAG